MHRIDGAAALGLRLKKFARAWRMGRMENGKWKVENGKDRKAGVCRPQSSILHLRIHSRAGKGLSMRWFWALLVLLSVGGAAFAQDSPQPDQLRKMYDEVLGQLRQAQDRKNELAAENDKLNAKVADLQKQLDAAKSKIDDGSREAAGFAEKTFFLRSHYAAWQEFIHRYPKLEARWRIFLRGDVLEPDSLPEMIDTDWPMK
jgi:hypothetical protein